LERVAESSTHGEQVINTRRELVKLIENVSMAQPSFLDEFTEEDKRLLTAKLHPDMAFDDVMAMEFQLYIFGHYPSIPLSSITVNTGLMLIALIECLEDRDTAINAIRQILWRAVNRIAPDGVQGKTKEDISLNEQIELLKI
jgi:hypothetical protein